MRLSCARFTIRLHHRGLLEEREEPRLALGGLGFGFSDKRALDQTVHLSGFPNADAHPRRNRLGISRQRFGDNHHQRVRGGIAVVSNVRSEQNADDDVASVAPDAVDAATPVEETTPNEKPTQDGPVRLDRSSQHNLVIMSRDGVRKRLRDPDSAEFRDVGYFSGGRSIAVCGEVNARNGFGGMTGYQRFIASGDIAFFQSEMEANEFAIAWHGLCVKAETDEVQIP